MNLLNICTKIILISFFSFSIGFCDEKMNDFFDNNPEKRWIFFADTVMGGKSSGKVVFRNQNGMNYAHLSGTVTTENNGGFIQIRKKIKARTYIEQIFFAVGIVSSPSDNDDDNEFLSPVSLSILVFSSSSSESEDTISSSANRLNIDFLFFFLLSS